MKHSSPPTVHILLATYQGAEHIEEQLHSIAIQTHKQWRLLISDDGSEDGTLKIIKHFTRQHPGKVNLINGPRKGSTANFFNLIQKVNHDRDTDLFAFCDQDDSWLPGKLEKALDYHKNYTSIGDPNLYCGRTIITDDKLNPTRLSEIPKRPLTFENALIQNVSSGNTMVFNVKMLDIMTKIAPEHSVWHDWTAYLVATACGGRVYYDKEPQILYRQHSMNVIGSNNAASARASKLISISRGMYRAQNDLMELAVCDIDSLLTRENRETFNSYLRARHGSSGINRLKSLFSSKVYRQKSTDQFALITLTYLGLI